jgi:hypothetical protein
MKSSDIRRKRFYLKNEAIELRKSGFSIKKICTKLDVPLSTASGWLKNVIISPVHQERLKNEWNLALVKARKSAVLWHNKQKEKRMMISKELAMRVINSQNTELLELALSMIYLAEGFKTNSTGMGNSDPLILKYFVFALINIYHVNLCKIRCELHIRSDQNPEEMKIYWSDQLNIPLSNFKSTSIDQRTKGKPTYSSYKGVCIVRCGNVAIQRKLIYLSRMFCERALERAVSSSG